MVKPTNNGTFITFNNGTLITFNNGTNIDNGKLYKLIVR